MSKPRIIKDYEKLDAEVLEQLKLVYPYGFEKHLVKFVNKDGESKKGLPFETETHIYLIRMNEDKARAIIREDDDYDDDGSLRLDIKEDYEEKHGDEDFLNELNDNADNDLGG